MQTEVPYAFRVDAPGVVFVRCAACSEPREIEESLLVVRDAEVAPTLVAMSIEHLRHNFAEELESLRREMDGAPPIEPPVSLPRSLLAVVLDRDVANDLRDRTTAIAEVEQRVDDETLSRYSHFLDLVHEHEEQQGPRRALTRLRNVPLSDLADWLDEHHSLLLSDAAQTYIEDGLRWYSSKGDAVGVEGMKIVGELVDALRRGDPIAKAAEQYCARIGEHIQIRIRPEVDRLWRDRWDPDDRIAIPALRQLVDGTTDLNQDGDDTHRQLLMELARRLSGGSSTSVTAEAVGLLQRVRELSLDRDDLWAQATGVLAKHLGSTRTGDLLSNWEDAVSLAREAASAELGDRTLADYRTSLGLYLSERPGGSSREHYDEALHWLYSALNAGSPQDDLLSWAYSKVNLSVAHRGRGVEGDVERAVDHLRDVSTSALRADTPETVRLVIYVELNLAGAMVEAEIGAISEALAIIDRAHGLAQTANDPFLVAWASAALGNALKKSRGPSCPEAVMAWRAGVDALDPRIHGRELLSGWTQALTHAYEQLGDWHNAADVYQRLDDAAQHLYNSQQTVEGRKTVLQMQPRLARWAAQAFARAGRVTEAVETLERGRARELDFNVRHDSADLARLQRVDPHLAECYVNDVTTLQRASAAASDPLSVVDSREAKLAFEHLLTTTEEIRSLPGFAEFLKSLAVPEMLAATSARQVIYLCAAPQTSMVLCVRLDVDGGVSAACDLFDNPTSRDLAELVTVREADGIGVFAAQAAGDMLVLQRTLDVAAEELSPMLKAVAAYVAAVEGPTVLVPAGLFASLPLQSLPYDRSGTTLDDEGTIHIAPSLSVYTGCERRAKRQVPLVFVGIADTSSDAPLPGTRTEVAAIAAHDGWTRSAVAMGEEATLAWFESHAPSASHLHLTCHGYSQLGGAGDYDGRLVLAGGDDLSSDALLRGSSLLARVAVASACQSGLYDVATAPDEFSGLPSALLQAGAACAIATLWPVYVEPAALLMCRFYETLLAEADPTAQDPQGALRNARRWLRHLTAGDRDEYLRRRPYLKGSVRPGGPISAGYVAEQRPFEDSHFWGAFVAYGA